MSTLPTKETIKEGAVILIDKSLTWTSFDAINKVRKHIHTKIGHCGTLDPLATGLLICCTGKMTKQINNYQRLPKEYTGTFTLGATTPTYDLESEPENFKDYQHISDNQIMDLKEKFTGLIQQTPPIHSAIKRKGKRAYELARAGIEIKLEPRPVTIYSFEITKIELPKVHFKIECSTGTYIRSLAFDFGAELGCGAYLSELRRTKIGDFKAGDALTVPEWVNYLSQD